MSKHTPGPWTAHNRTTSAIPSFLITSDDGNKGIARTLKGTKEEQANAALIAAAPELLEALKALGAYEGDGWHDPEAVKLAHAAIAKAEGRD